MEFVLLQKMCERTSQKNDKTQMGEGRSNVHHLNATVSHFASFFYVHLHLFYIIVIIFNILNLAPPHYNKGIFCILNVFYHRVDKLSAKDQVEKNFNFTRQLEFRWSST